MIVSFSISMSTFKTNSTRAVNNNLKLFSKEKKPMPSSPIGKALGNEILHAHSFTKEFKHVLILSINEEGRQELSQQIIPYLVN